MILIDKTEIKTVLEGFTWAGAKDICTRNLSFSFLYNPLKNNIPRYKAAAGSRVEWREENKPLFIGYIESMSYNTNEDSISIACCDFSAHLARSKFIGRMKGTLNELTNKICAAFNIQNGINVDNSHMHNIVSNGDLTYYDVLKTALDTMFERYTLYMDGDTLKLATNEIIATYEIGKNIRSSNLIQSISDMVTRVLILDDEGKILQAVEDNENLLKFGLFQETYSYNKDCKNNLAEAKNLLKGVSNEGKITADNDNNCISGRFIKIIEPVNNFVGIFEIKTDNHNIGQDSFMDLEVEYVASR